MRTFIAIESSAAVRRSAQGLIQRLAATGADVKWVEPDNLHWTLNFLGEVEPKLIDEVCRTAAAAAAAHEPFAFVGRGTGAFPDVEHPRTVWLGVAPETEPPLVRLQAAVADALAKIGFVPEARRFHPHLTLGRVRRPDRTLRQLSDLLARQADFEAGSVEVGEVTIYSSQLGREGPRHEPLARCPLG